MHIALYNVLSSSFFHLSFRTYKARICCFCSTIIVLMEMSTFLIFKLFFLFISYLPKDFEIYLLSFHRIRNQIWTESVQMVYSHFQKKNQQTNHCLKACFPKLISIYLYTRYIIPIGPILYYTILYSTIPYCTVLVLL